MRLFLQVRFRAIVEEVLELSDSLHRARLVETDVGRLLVEGIARIVTGHLHVAPLRICLIIFLEVQDSRLVVPCLKIAFAKHVKAFLAI